MSNERCVHHWAVDEFNVGRCIRCHTVRDFGALMDREPDIFQPSRERGRKHHKRGRKKKQATSGGIASVTMSR
ncbi:hypothetical protein ES703_43072 [subsurface metagenome]|jgi:hypothetical protein